MITWVTLKKMIAQGPQRCRTRIPPHRHKCCAKNVGLHHQTVNVISWLNIVSHKGRRIQNLDPGCVIDPEISHDGIYGGDASNHADAHVAAFSPLDQPCSDTVENHRISHCEVSHGGIAASSLPDEVDLFPIDIQPTPTPLVYLLQISRF
ncbi:hypothetical protein QA943_07085 [Streptomyces sp. B21-097]